MKYSDYNLREGYGITREDISKKIAELIQQANKIILEIFNAQLLTQRKKPNKSFFKRKIKQNSYSTPAEVIEHLRKEKLPFIQQDDTQKNYVAPLNFIIFSFKIEQNLQVKTKFILDLTRTASCHLCNSHVSSYSDYTIKHLQNKEKITLNEGSLHMVDQHSDFRQLVKIAKVLGLGNVPDNLIVIPSRHLKAFKINPDLHPVHHKLRTIFVIFSKKIDRLYSAEKFNETSKSQQAQFLYRSHIVFNWRSKCKSIKCLECHPVKTIDHFGRGTIYNQKLKKLCHIDSEDLHLFLEHGYYARIVTKLIAETLEAI